ncbi:hypothetical protein Glove_724g18 [Diversispora epigaea]|uniref:Uncharacterized protein n=1 Tax=Diversispora epigaea TaxID=1348612 RepID=A0A397G0B8_9GLOM|nr:hypothetical protein Glove_724g18 [Diversispora epigaea]
MEIKLLKEKKELLDKELSHQISLEQTRHILNVTSETRNQGALLQSEVTTKIKKRTLDKSDVSCEQLKRRVKVTNRVKRSKVECINVEQDKGEIISDEQNISNEIDEENEVLTSGKCIEDTLFEHYKKLPNKLLLHSWIIDLNDQKAKELFTIEK